MMVYVPISGYLFAEIARLSSRTNSFGLSFPDMASIMTGNLSIGVDEIFNERGVSR